MATGISLQPLTESVLNTELIALLKSNKTDVSRISDLIYYTPSKTIDTLQANLDATVKSATWPSDGVQVNPQSLQLVIQALLQINPNKVTSLSGIYDAIKTAGKAVFKVQHGMVVGEVVQADGSRSFSARQSSYVDRIMNYVEAAVESAIPFTTAMATTGEVSQIASAISIGDAEDPDIQAQLQAIQQCFAVLTSSIDATDDYIPDPPKDMSMFFKSAVDVIQRSVRMSVPDKDLIDWLFPDQVLQAYTYVALGSYLRLRYLGTFIPSSTEPGKSKADASFYDARYSQLLILNAIRSAVTTVANVDQVSAADRGALMAINGAIQTTLATTTEREVGGEALKNMYGQVAKLSAQARDGSKSLNARSSTFDKRRSKIRSLQQDAVFADLRRKRAYTSLMLWLAAYVLTLVIAIYLIVTDNLSGFLLLCGVSLGISSLFIIVAIAQKTVNRINVTWD